MDTSDPPEATGIVRAISDCSENPEVTSPSTWRENAMKPIPSSIPLEAYVADVPCNESSVGYSPSSSSRSSVRPAENSPQRSRLAKARSTTCVAVSHAVRRTVSAPGRTKFSDGEDVDSPQTSEEDSSTKRKMRWTTSSSSDESVEGLTVDSLERQLREKEQELMASVPDLLDSMNASSQNLNDCESQLAEEEKKYDTMVSHWQRLHGMLRNHYGSGLVDRARPYFEAVADLKKISGAVQKLVGEYGEAMSIYEQSKARLRSIEQSLQYGAHDIRLDAQQQEHLSKATMHVLVAQEERDHLETCYAKVLGDFKRSQAQEDARRKEIGNTCISKARPCFNQIERYEQSLRIQQTVLDDLVLRTEVAKCAYEDALRSLENVNNAVHALRTKYTAFIRKARRT